MKNKKELKKAINQLGRVKKSPVLDPLDKKTIDRIRNKLYTKVKDVGKMFKIENLVLVHYDSGIYTLEFQKDGKSDFIDVNEHDHPKAATDEHYFNDKKIVEQIILENK